MNSPVVPPNITEPVLDAPIFRYMSFEGLKDFLVNKRLRFASPWTFIDKSEGQYSTGNEQEIIEKLITSDANSGENLFRSLHFMRENFSSLLAHNIYASCWYVADNEMMSMWERFAGGGGGVAIQSKYSSLKSVFDDQFFIGLIKYYENLEILPHNFIFRYFYKTKLFEDEKELRVIFYENPLGLLGINTEGFYYRPADPSSFIEKIIISPFASAEYVELIAKLAMECGIEIQASVHTKNSLHKVQPILEYCVDLLKKYANPNCLACKGAGYIKNDPFEVTPPFPEYNKLCAACDIKNKWEHIRTELLKKLKE